MKRRILLFLFVYEPLAELAYTLLRWADNKRKGKVVSEFWTYMWVMVVYGVINGHVPLSDIEEGWRKGTWFEYKGRRHLDPELVGVDRMRDVDSSYTIVGQRDMESPQGVPLTEKNA